MNEPWVNKSIQLKFLMGEVFLFTVKLPALVFNAHFSNLTSDLNEPRLPVERFSSKMEAIMIRSHPVDQELPRLNRLDRTIRYVPAHYQHYYIDLQCTFSEYLAKFSSKSRSTLQKKVRKFAEFSGGEVCWREYRYPEDAETYYRLAREVSQKTYQERLLKVGLPDDDEFLREIKDLASRDQFRGYLLFHQEKPIAYLYCPIQDNILLYRNLGYDPEFRQWSPGTVLQYVVLERLFSEGKYRMFDFTEGEGQHKEFFSTGSIQCADIYYLRPTLRNLLLLRVHSGLKTFSSSTVKFLDRFGLKAKIKKLIRSKG
ncbi:MAG TPA: GNAT family N-acetyltransferase [Blastocatellia bacterium]|nr:GNAT family N-acetyltransferase [Blastocatellia bacterium]